jgi:ubiquinone/menaquinone biosynthesis C-methylase UbiE
MDHFEAVYAEQADKYHQLITSEDVDGNLLPALQRLAHLENATLLDLGSGTGRIPILVHELVERVFALDLNYPMLREQEEQQRKIGSSWPLVNGDNRFLPFPDDRVDVVTAGWAIGHLKTWFSDDWQVQMGLILQEMERVAVPGGSIVIMETMTTGALVAAPPTPELAEYYAWLEEEWGYSCHVIQTDYQFASVVQAVEQTEFFFGPKLAKVIREKGWARLPEWTGLWWKHNPA